MADRQGVRPPRPTEVVGGLIPYSDGKHWEGPGSQVYIVHETGYDPHIGFVGVGTPCAYNPNGNSRPTGPLVFLVLAPRPARYPSN